MKIKVAILDTDARYLLKLGNAFSNKYTDKIQLYSFTEEEVALETIKTAKIDVFIANKQFNIHRDTLPKGCGFAYLVDSKDEGSGSGEYTICKYQKVDVIYKDLLAVYAEIMASYNEYVEDSLSKIPFYVFVSASGGTGSSTVAAAYAISQVKQGKKPLYINLEAFGNSESFFTGEGSGNFSNIIYAIKSKKSNLSLILESNVKLDPRGVYFLESCKVSCDLLEMSSVDLRIMIQEINKIEHYDSVVLDMDYQMGDFMFEAFQCAKNIIFVNDGSDIANQKFLKALQTMEIMEQQKEMRFLGKISMIYNKFRNRTSTMIADNEVKVLGGIQQFEGATVMQVVEQISNAPYLMQIM